MGQHDTPTTPRATETRARLGKKWDELRAEYDAWVERGKPVPASKWKKTLKDPGTKPDYIRAEWFKGYWSLWCYQFADKVASYMDGGRRTTLPALVKLTNAAVKEGGDGSAVKGRTTLHQQDHRADGPRRKGYAQLAPGSLLHVKLHYEGNTPYEFKDDFHHWIVWGRATELFLGHAHRREHHRQGQRRFAQGVGQEVVRDAGLQVHARRSALQHSPQCQGSADPEEGAPPATAFGRVRYAHEAHAEGGVMIQLALILTQVLLDGRRTAARGRGHRVEREAERASARAHRRQTRYLVAAGRRWCLRARAVDRVDLGTVFDVTSIKLHNGIQRIEGGADQFCRNARAGRVTVYGDSALVQSLESDDLDKHVYMTEVGKWGFQKPLRTRYVTIVIDGAELRLR